jgi:hypothetical protein
MTDFAARLATAEAAARQNALRDAAGVAEGFRRFYAPGESDPRSDVYATVADAILRLGDTA